MSRTITREDLAVAARDAAGPSMDHAEARDLVDQVFDAVADAVIAGKHSREHVKIKGFGAFLAWGVSERVGRNPKRPAEIHTIPAHWRLLFRPARNLLIKLNPGIRVNPGRVGRERRGTK